jgi:hypothetical protein
MLRPEEFEPIEPEIQPAHDVAGIGDPGRKGMPRC